MIVENQATITDRVFEIALAPLNNPEIISSVLPLILGAFIIELYFGKHKTEVLGWNTSVGNAILWISTSLNLIISGAPGTTLEKVVTYFILLMGSIIAYMDFFHKWSPSTAFKVSSPDVIYPLAYVAVVITKTAIPANDLTIKASIGFIIGTVVFFRIIRMFETPAPNNFGNIRF